jgi:hypothetical protein
MPTTLQDLSQWLLTNGLHIVLVVPGKQFEVGRRLRALVVGALRRAGVATTEAVTSQS